MPDGILSLGNFLVAWRTVALSSVGAVEVGEGVAN